VSRYVRLDALDEIERTMTNLLRSARGRAVQVPHEVLEPYDGKPALRPHTIPGWWQVWSGGICIALLSHREMLTCGRFVDCHGCGEGDHDGHPCLREPGHDGPHNWRGAETKGGG
jgi:hypothetical protein